MLVVDEVPGCHNWVGLLAASLLWKLAGHLLISWKLGLRDGCGFQVRGLRVLFMKCMVSSTIRIYLPPLGRGCVTKSNSKRLYVWESLGHLWPTTQKKAPLCLVWKVFLFSWSLTLRGSIINPDEEKKITKTECVLGVVAHPFNPSTWGAGGALRLRSSRKVRGRGYTRKLCLEKNKTRKDV